MMKIHTTQNLNSLAKRHSTNNNIINTEFRYNYAQDNMSNSMLLDSMSLRESAVSFKSKKKPNSKDMKKIIEITKKVVGNIKKEAQPEMKRGDKFLNSSLFNSLLKVADYETVVQAAIAAAICIALRPLTIMALPTKKGKTKEDNIYASAHSMASGMVGLVTAFALTAPFKSGSKYVMEHMYKNLSEKTLKRLSPHLNIDSIANGSKERVGVDLWKDYAGNTFCKELKDCQKLPEFKQFADISEETFNKVLNLNIDFAAQKNKSFNELITKDGKNIYDAIDFSRVGIKVKEGEETIQVLLSDIDKNFLEGIIKDSKGIKDNNWGNLDINSVFGKDGVIKNVREWKDLNGKNWKLDLDQAYVSSAFETASYRPRVSGKRIKETGKLATYQKNENIGDKLGTEITMEMLQAEKNNEGLIKALTWLPDLSFRVPVAVGTIALIPWVLKNVFHIQKNTKKAPEQIQQNQINNTTEKTEETKEGNQTKDNVSFKGKKDPSWFAKKMGEIYGKPLIESEWIAKISAGLSKIPGGATQFMTAFGSLITSSVYVQQTLSNKDLDSDRKRTLAINQALCFVVPTAAAYAVDRYINGWVKKQEYKYCGWQERAMEIAKYEGKEKVAKELKKGLGDRLKGVRILAQLATFTLIYRYVTPVLITPVANWIGDKLRQKNKQNEIKQEAKKVA